MDITFFFSIYFPIFIFPRAHQHNNTFRHFLHVQYTYYIPAIYDSIVTHIFIFYMEKKIQTHYSHMLFLLAFRMWQSCQASYRHHQHHHQQYNRVYIIFLAISTTTTNTAQNLHTITSVYMCTDSSTIYRYNTTQRDVVRHNVYIHRIMSFLAKVKENSVQLPLCHCVLYIHTRLQTTKLVIIFHKSTTSYMLCYNAENFPAKTTIFPCEFLSVTRDFLLFLNTRKLFRFSCRLYTTQLIIRCIIR